MAAARKRKREPLLTVFSSFKCSLMRFYLVASGSVFSFKKKKGRNSQVSGKARGRATRAHVGDISASTFKHSSVFGSENVLAA